MTHFPVFLIICYIPFSESHLVRIIEPQGEPAQYELPHFQDNWSDDSLVRNSNGQFPAKIIVNWRETMDYPDWVDAESTGVTLSDEEMEIFIGQEAMLPPEKDKLAGYPRWVLDPEYPNCPICDRSMDRLIFEFASDDNIPYLWGDCGTGYFLQCPEHKEQVTFLWQCS